VNSKYQYRSSVIVEDDDDDDFGEVARSIPADSSSVVDRFIRVIESKDQVPILRLLNLQLRRRCSRLDPFFKVVEY
jgi:hypothetical protein